MLTDFYVAFATVCFDAIKPPLDALTTSNNAADCDCSSRKAIHWSVGLPRGQRQPGT